MLTGNRWPAPAQIPRATRAALWGVKEIVSLLLASLIAGFATTPYAAYHFHRIAPYGVIANLLAMPVVSAWVMPMSLLGVVALLAVNKLLEDQMVKFDGLRTTRQHGHKLASMAYHSAPFKIVAMTSAAESSALRVRFA